MEKEVLPFLRDTVARKAVPAKGQGTCALLLAAVDRRARRASDHFFQLVKLDEAVGLTAELVGDHRRLRTDRRDDGHPHALAWSLKDMTAAEGPEGAFLPDSGRVSAACATWPSTAFAELGAAGRIRHAAARGGRFLIAPFGSATLAWTNGGRIGERWVHGTRGDHGNDCGDTSGTWRRARDGLR